MSTMTWTIKETNVSVREGGPVILVTLAAPPQTVNGMPLFVAEQAHVVEQPSTMATLVADLAKYAKGNTVAATYADPVPPAKAAA